MSHLHIPDGLLSPGWWVSGFVVALILLIRASRLSRAASPQRIAYQGALGALMLAAMSIPLGPFEYHLTLAGPTGVLLGGAGSFQVAFIVSTILALMGHGGITVIGLNALVLGSAAAIARRVFNLVRPRMRADHALALATGAGQAVAGLLWLVLVTAAIRGWNLPSAMVANGAVAAERAHLAPIAAVGIPLWLVGIAAESLVAYGIGRFLTRVHPALLAPEPQRAMPSPLAHGEPA
jgi:ABC-type Co2+ transport system permease subunit